VSANELSLTFLLKMDGGQSVAAEFQRLTAQINSQLAGLNKPNDGAAAAAISLTKEVNKGVVSSEAEKNKQIEAMWAERQAQVSTSLTKEAQVAAAYAARETQSARESQSQIVSAHQQRERQVESIARQESAAWSKHEAGKLSSTRQAEKQGEAIVAQSNAAKEQSSKKTETRRRQQRKDALQDIARLERERLQIATQNEKAIERLAKQEADTRIREGKRVANSVLATLRDLQREEQRLRSRLAQRASSGTNAFLAGAVGGITALVGVSIVSEIRQAGEAWLEYSNKLQTTKIAFTTMLGSAQLAEDHLKELQAFALKTPFQFGELIDASQRMQALGFRAEQVIPVLTDVGNAVAAAGGGSERLDRVTLALSQIQSKGKVMTQELNQLAEAGIPAFKILQETLHKSRSEINEMVKDGEIGSKVFLDAFQKFSQQNFGGLMEAQSKTFSGAMSNVKDALLQTSATAFAPLFERLTQLATHFNEAAQSSDDFKKKLETVGQVSVTIFDGIVEVILAVRDAIRIVAAAISGEVTFVVETVKEGTHLAAAIFAETFATIKTIQGDAAAAARLHQAAQEELRLGAIAGKKAFDAQANTIKTIIDVYREAEERAKALANAQQKVSAPPEIAAGILRKKKTTTEEEDLEKKTKGADPAVTAKRLAELRLQDTIAGLDAEENALKRSLARRETEFELYAAQVEVLENNRSRQVIAGLLEEARAAAKIRKEGPRQIAEQEIENRRRQEERRHAAEVNKLTDETEDRKRKQFETTTTVRRETIDAQLKIAAIGDEQRITAIRTLADARVKTEEQAERDILKIRLAAIDREKERLQAEVIATESIKDPEEQLKVRAKLNLDLRVLTAERTAIEQDGDRGVDDARRKDLSNVRRYAEELKAIEQQVVDIQRENAEAVLRLMEFHFASRLQIIRARLKLDLESENTRHQQAEETIRNLERENRESNRTQAEKDAEAATLNRLREAEEERHRLAMQGIRAQGRRDEQDASPFGKLELGKDQLKQFAAELESSIIPLNRLLSDSFFQVADAIGSVVANWVLLGETGPAIGRKILAQALANLAAEATVQALKETALGFATLFFNPAESAAHFTSAGIWAAIGGVAAVAGRSVAGDLFKQKTASAGGLSSSGSGSQSQALQTITQGRNQQQSQVVRHEHVLRVVADDGKFGQALDTHFESGFRNGGKLRELILNDGGV
jgi:tape measure domain-containing protein